MALCFGVNFYFISESSCKACDIKNHNDKNNESTVGIYWPLSMVQTFSKYDQLLPSEGVI